MDTSDMHPMSRRDDRCYPTILVSHEERNPERGATLVFVALLLVSFFGFMALAVDVGMMMTARSEAQRTADAAALAGASEYMDMNGVATEAESRARDFAGQNTIRRVLVNPDPDAGEVEVQVLHDDQEVQVWVGRAIPTFFARLIGIDEVPVRAMASARVFEAGAAKCLKPFAVPDSWVDHEGNGDPENYVRFEGDNNDGGPGERATGYGSNFRDGDGRLGDYGRQISLKPQNPRDESIMEPSVFFPWRLPDDDGNSAGASVYRSNIATCNETPINLFEPYYIQTGNMVGPTQQGVKDLVNEDPDAYWDDEAGEVRGSDLGMDSPRVVKIALFDPRQITSSGMQTIEFNNFGLFFIEEQVSQQDPVVGRFLFYVEGQDPGPNAGSLVRVLQLVK